MDLPRLVMKFGGTSVQDADAIRRAADIIAAALERRPLVVVSAAAGVTNDLCQLLEAAPTGTGDEELERLDRRHRQLLADLRLEPTLLNERLGELRDLIHGIRLLREVTPRTWDLCLSYGEFLLAPIMAAHLMSRGVTAKAWDAGTLGLVTDDRFNRARPLPEAYERIPATLRDAETHLPVVTGFAGQTMSGDATTLGRGGSDYSASIIARAIEAEELQIWTDVDGILTADPRVVPNARLIPMLGFREASELAFSGAKVLHPQTITPAMERDIPVRVSNTMDPTGPGSLIVSDETIAAGGHGAALRSIAHKKDVHVVTIISPRMVARPGFLARLSRVFEHHGVSIDMISTSEVSVSLTTDEPPDRVPGLLEDLREFSTVEIECGRGMVSLVGGRLGESAKLFGEIFDTVAKTRADVEMISYGATRINLSFLVPGDAVEAVVRALHGRYFEG